MVILDLSIFMNIEGFLDQDVIQQGIKILDRLVGRGFITCVIGEGWYLY